MNNLLVLSLSILGMGAVLVSIYKLNLFKKYSKDIVKNIATLALLVLPFTLFPNIISSAEAQEVANVGKYAIGAGMGYLAAALTMGLSSLAAGIAIAAAAPAAIGAFSENPKSFGKVIVFVVLGEGLSIFGLLISFMILQQVK